MALMTPTPSRTRVVNSVALIPLKPGTMLPRDQAMSVTRSRRTDRLRDRGQATVLRTRGMTSRLNQPVVTRQVRARVPQTAVLILRVLLERLRRARMGIR